MFLEQYPDVKPTSRTFEGWEISHVYAPHRPLYRLVQEIGRGGAGAVYLAVDLTAFSHSPKQTIYRAVKVLKNHDIPARNKAALIAEGRLHARVQRYPNFLTFFDVVYHRDYKFFVLEINQMMDTDLWKFM